MATEIRRRRGSTADHATFTGAPAELTVDTDKNTIVVHDGATVGGWPVPTGSESLRDVEYTALSEGDSLVRISGVFVNTSSETTALNLPSGTNAQRPNTGQFAIRFNTDAGAYEGYNGTAWTALGAGSAELVTYNNTTSGLSASTVQEAIDQTVAFAPIGTVQFFNNRAAVGAGYIVYDGQELSRATYPDLWNFAQTIGLVETEADWQADPAVRGRFSDGDGSTTFRVPDYNGQSVGSFGAVYLTGDGLKSAGEAGLIRQDEMQQITGWYNANQLGNPFPTSDPVFEGALFYDDSKLQKAGTANSSGSQGGISFDSANSPDARTNTYTHGIDVTGVWAGRAFGAVVNVGSADAAQLASDYANLAGEVSALEGYISRFDTPGDAPLYACRAWVNFNGTTTPPTIRASGNVSSIIRNGTGDYTVNFALDMPDTDYVTLCTVKQHASNDPRTMYVHQEAPSVGSVRVLTALTTQNNFRDQSASVAVFR